MRFTCAQLAQLRLPGYPTSRQGWDKLVKEKAWPFEEFNGKGRGGVRREYLPPPEIMFLIDARQRGDLPTVPVRSPVEAQPPGKAESERAVYNLSDGTGALLDQQAIWAEAAIRLAFIVRSKPQFAIAREDMLQRISLLAFRLVFMFCDGDIQHMNKWLNDAGKTDGLVQMAYEGDCIKRDVAPGSDLNPSPNDPVNNFL